MFEYTINFGIRILYICSNLFIFIFELAAIILYYCGSRKRHVNIDRRSLKANFQPLVKPVCFMNPPKFPKNPS